jgi:hypothetical protein
LAARRNNRTDGGTLLFIELCKAKKLLNAAITLPQTFPAHHFFTMASFVVFSTFHIFPLLQDIIAALRQHVY